ncbi:heavy-metal-associated domain-containing protein [Frigidibacter sp. RF13]|uniref:heavy-metal-associated domain-containing protein n=1 Tax=Frigidibacter sp. RF13 TaxID=2997340 RepID=UPI002270887E|nr:heavy-metal-associated domain-containing protein [Frigidibacter sp. RF13]MCY1127069.1 heavy-metal-associated domain-containing protein [Frigidibacter sp. RF13]
MKLSIPDMSCGHCKATVEKTIAAVDPGAKVAVDLGSRTADITSGAATEAILAALKAEGYPATPAA